MANPLYHQPPSCKIDSDCEISVPTGILFLIPIYCDNGQCKRGLRKPEITEPQACNHTTDCLNGGICINHLCQPFVPPTLAPLPPLPHDNGLEKCRENADCKERNHHCNNGFCKPVYQQPPSCKVDSDCEISVPTGILFWIPIYCEKGQCKRGLRKPEITEPQACNHTTDCLNGGICINHLCQPFVPPTLAPLPPLPHDNGLEKCRENADCKERNHHCNNGFCKPVYHQPPSCKVDSDCEISVPTGILLLIPVFCDNGKCNMGIRTDGTVTRKPKSPELQICNQDSDCVNGGVCRHRRCKVHFLF
uniref:Uncharacterized protein n=1 Tax=Panagrolaimus davidi TaxID=227884 RepID=A0A914QXF6_9BILA